MGYPRCFEVDRDIVEERRDTYGRNNGCYDNNYHYNHMIVQAARYKAKSDEFKIAKNKSEPDELIAYINKRLGYTLACK